MSDAEVDLSVFPNELETYDRIPPATIAALDLLALTLPGYRWRVDVTVDHGVRVTARPHTPKEAA